MKNRRRERCQVLSTRVLVEPLEERVLLSIASTLAAMATKSQHATHTFMLAKRAHPHTADPPAAALTPAQIRGAYGVDQITVGSVVGNGAGQTIAIVDAYDYPTAYNDLETFSSTFDLPGLRLYDASGNTTPYFRRVAQDGSTNYPPTDPAGAGNSKGTWELEESLDIEWAHALAPDANIILVEANDTSYTNLIQNGVNWARNQPGVSVVSMSFGSTEYSGEKSLDTYFTTPAGHAGVTFVASTGDDAKPGGYPAFSPNVVAVGGTSLTVNGDSYVSETGWSDSGGGVSKYESQPAYQNGVVTQSATKRATPDVSMDADPTTGVAIYDSWDYGTSNGWLQIGGTSVAAPLFSGLIAVADQLRAANNLPALDGPTQTLPMLYQLPASDFHDITSGNNGFNAGAGYDLVTGRGSPIANLLVPALVGVAGIQGQVFQDNNGDGIFDGSDVPLAGVTVFLDANNNGILDSGSLINPASTNVPLAIPDNNPTGITSTLNITGADTPITDVNITFSINHTYDSDLTAYLISPQGTVVTLFSRVGGSGDNFTNTTLDDQASASLSSASPPFTGTFRPSSGLLATFNGQNADGTWQLKVVDGAAIDTGSLIAWSLQIASGPEASTVTDSKGNYAFPSLTFGAGYTVRQILPPGEVQESPVSGAGQNVVVTGNVTGVDFADFPTVFTATGDNDAFYLRLDPTATFLQIDDAAVPLDTPTYQIALVALPSLTFNLDGAANNLTADFSNGAPIPLGNISLVALPGSNDTLTILGQTPSQNFDMTDTQIGPTAGSAILYQNLSTLALDNATVNYAGSLATLNNLVVGPGATFIWN